MRLSRRSLLQLAAGAALAATLPGRGLLAAGNLTAATPPGLPAMVLARALQDTRVTALVPAVDLRSWRDPDQLRAWLAGGEISLAAIPTNVAANLYNRGLPLRLLNVCVWGVLGVLSHRQPLVRVTDLAGRRVGVPFRGDMPDLVLRCLAGRAGMDPAADLDITYLSTPFEAVQMFLARRLDAVVLPEPARSAARLQGGSLGLELRELDLQAEWARLTDGPAEVPQAGIACRQALAEDAAELLAALQAACVSAVEWIHAEPAAAAELGASVFDLPAPVLEAAIARTGLEARPATGARPALEAFFEALAELSPGFIGGRLPDSAFYLAP